MRIVLTPFFLMILCASFLSQTSYQIVKKIPIKGQGGWDYLIVDENARRLFVSHGTEVKVLDVDSGAEIGTITNTLGVHGIALADDADRGFVSDGQTSTVTIFDLKTLKAIAEVPTGKKPDAIIYDPATSRVFAFNGGSDNATVLSAKDGKVVGTVPLGGGPEFAVADGKGYVFNNLEDQSAVVKVNSRKLTVEERWPTAPCESPSSLAMDQKNRRLFIGCRNRLMAVMNADSGKVIATLPIGDHVDAGAFDPGSGLVFTSNGDGTLSVFHEDGPDKYTPVQTVTTIPRARTMALDRRTGKIFLSTVENGQFEVLVVAK